MKTDIEGLHFITKQEGVRLETYNDVAGIPTVGIGHKLLPGESYPNGITLETAQFLLSKDVEKCDEAIDHLGWELTQNQWNALADFCFNLGGGALLQLANHGMDQVPQQLPRWCHAKINGVETVVPDLANRRDAEVRLWLG